MASSTPDLTSALIVLATGTAIPIVTMFVNLLKPFIERLPMANPTNPADKGTHDALIQIVNAIATIVVTLTLAVMFGYISDPSQAWIAGVQIIGIMLGADFNYRGSAKSGSGATPIPTAPAPTPLAARLTVSPAQVADALNSAIQSASPQPAPSAMPNAMPNAVKTLADDERPDEPPVTVKLPIVKPAAPAISAAAHA